MFASVGVRVSYNLLRTNRIILHKINTCERRRPSSLIVTARLVHGKNETQNLPGIVRWSKHLWTQLFGKYLLATNIVSSGILMVVGDFVAQEYEYRSGARREEHYDIDRFYRMFVAGALQGPLHHYVYAWMDRTMPQRTFRTIANKILIDQIIMSPLCILIFFYTLCFLERQSLENTNKEIIDKFPYIYLMDWILWPAAQYANFRYLDQKYRVAFVNVCTAAYNVLMSYIKHNFHIDITEGPSSSEPMALLNSSGNKLSEQPANVKNGATSQTP